MRRSTARLLTSGLAALFIAPAPAPARSVDSQSSREITVPLVFYKGGLLLAFTAEGQLYRGVLDTGSPFTLLGTCRGECTRFCRIWGCGKVTSGEASNFTTSVQVYASGEVQLTWRRCALSLGQQDLGKLIVGVEGGSERPFFGVLPGSTRGEPAPPFLSQTGFRSLIIDLTAGAEQFSLSTGLLLKSGTLEHVIPLVDLRKLGAPLQYFAAEVSSLYFGEERIEGYGKIFAVIDTGTTGLAVPAGLYDVLKATRGIQTSRFGNKRKATALRVEFQAERGPPVALLMRQGSALEYGGASFNIVTPLPLDEDMSEFSEESASLWAGGDVRMPRSVQLKGRFAEHPGLLAVTLWGEKCLTRGQNFSVRIVKSPDSPAQVGIGLAPKTLRGSLGVAEQTCVYTSYGAVLAAGQETDVQGPRLVQGDVVTCGILQEGSVCWSVNGRFLGQIQCELASLVYPTVVLAGAEVELIAPGGAGLNAVETPDDRPLVIFVGLGFLLGRRIIIDTLEARAAFEQ